MLMHLTNNSHEMPSLVFTEKIIQKKLECCLLQFNLVSTLVKDKLSFEQDFKWKHTTILECSKHKVGLEWKFKQALLQLKSTDIFLYFSMKTCVVGTHLKCLTNMLLMSTHNMQNWEDMLRYMYISAYCKIRSRIVTFWSFFFCFSTKIGFDISCKLSPRRHEMSKIYVCWIKQ